MRFGFPVFSCFILRDVAEGDGVGFGEGAVVTMGTGFLGAGETAEATTGPVAVTAAIPAATAAAVTPWAAMPNPCSAICCRRHKRGS